MIRIKLLSWNVFIILMLSCSTNINDKQLRKQMVRGSEYVSYAFRKFNITADHSQHTYTDFQFPLGKLWDIPVAF